MKRQSGGTDDRKGSLFSAPRVSGFFAGVLLFALIVVGYLAFVCIERALAKPRQEHLFQVFLVRGERVYGTTATMRGMFSAYRGEGSSNWRNYEYSGRMMLTDARGGIGVGFLVQSENAKRVFYRLMRFCEESDFTLRGQGLEVEHGENTDARLCPKPWTWYPFRVRAEDEGNQARIRAKIWEEHTPEPQKWKVDYLDRSPARNTRGSIGLETAGKGEKFFDDLLVRPIGFEEQAKPQPAIEMRDAEKEPEDAQRLLLRTDSDPWNGIPLYEEDFEEYPVGAHPIGWHDRTERRDMSDVADNLSHFLGMNILDFTGPWDEVVNLTTMCLVFGAAGFFAANAGKRRTSLGRSGILLTFLPFLLLFAYAGIPKGMLMILYVPAAVFAALAWALLERAVAAIISPTR